MYKQLINSTTESNDHIPTFELQQPTINRFTLSAFLPTPLSNQVTDRINDVETNCIFLEVRLSLHFEN